jgi:hypothetical protein
MKEFLIPLAFLSMGIFLIIKGIRLKMGYEKGRYFSPLVRAGNVAWMSLPGGLVLVMWGLMFLPSLLFGVSVVTATLGLFFLIGGLVIFFLGIIIAFIQPNFMKPRWLSWLEREHRDIMPLLRREAREMGFDVWGQRVETQEGLEAWVAEIRHKYKL